MEKQNGGIEAINFNGFSNDTNLDKFNGKEICYSIKNGKYTQIEYHCDANKSLAQKFDNTTNQWEVNARANRIPSNQKVSDWEKAHKPEDGYLYNGFLWIRPIGKDTAGICGRIACWVPKEIDNLEKLIYSGARTPEEINRRLEQIKISYSKK
jgi:hypothetical protein